MKKSLAHQLLYIFAFRLVLNTGRRFIYPFAPEVSRGLGVPIGEVTSIIATGQLTSLLGLFGGPLADRIGNRFMMSCGLALLALGMLLCGLLPHYWFVFAGLVLASFGKTVFDPAIQSFIGRNVPYQRRARAIGAIETAWAGSTLIGIPALGFVIDQVGLRASFFLMAVLGFIAWLTIGRVISEDRNEVGESQFSVTFVSALGQLIKVRPAAGMLIFGFCISIANDAVFIVFGLWAEDVFSVSLVTLGLSTIVIGIAELGGEAATALFSDRLGLRLSVVFSVILASVFYLLLPAFGVSFPLGLVGIFFIFLFFEMAMVTSFSLSTELMPSVRATMMAGFYGAAGLGRMLGVLLGSSGYQLGGIQVVAWGSGAFTIVGLLAFLWGVSGWRNVHS